MSLLIAHGLPKSGSTFLYQVAKDACEAFTGCSHYQAKARFFPGMDVPDFVAQPSDDFIAELMARLPVGLPFVLKTHGKLTPRMAELLRTGQVKAVVSFRDPRDTVISMLDAGESDRRKGANRFFGTLHQTEDAVGPAKHGWSMAREWVLCPGVLKIPYYLTATNQNVVIRLVCEYLGAGYCYYNIARRFGSDKKTRITEFHKGVADRFLEDLTPDDILALTDQFAGIIAETDALTGQWMKFYGYRMLYEMLATHREHRIQALRSEVTSVEERGG